MTTTRKRVDPILVLSDSEEESDVDIECDSPRSNNGQQTNPAPTPAQPTPAQPTPVQPVVVAPQNTTLVTTEVEFWEFITSIKWVNKTPGGSTRPRDVLKDSSPERKQSIKTFMEAEIAKLKDIFEESAVWHLTERDLNDNEKTALMSHIVARGQVFYVSMKKDPVFAAGLVGNTSNADAFLNFMAEF